MTKEDLKTYLLKYNFSINDETLNRLEDFMNLTLTANEKFNLTAIKNKDEFIEKMIFDSAIAFTNLDLDNKSIIDFGTGAGFPGIIIKILFPKAKVTLLDATKKKCDHLLEIKNLLHLDYDVINARGEDYARLHCEEYDYVTARAVSSLNVLIELTSNLIKIGGHLIALKGSKGYEEIEEARKIASKCGLMLGHINEDVLPSNNDIRLNIFYKKVFKTPSKFPRSYDEILKKPI